MLTADFKYLFDIFQSIGDEIWTVWGFHTTVFLAVAGYLISRRNNLDFHLKVIATIGYAMFTALIIGVLRHLYGEQAMAVKDITAIANKASDFHAHGYIYNEMTGVGSGEKLFWSIVICLSFSALMLVLIWTDGLESLRRFTGRRKETDEGG
jgi:hypothetical protein